MRSDRVARVSSDRLLAAMMPMIGASETLAAVAVALRLQRDGSVVDPQLAARLDAVLEALQLREAVRALGAHEATALLGIAESSLAQATAFATDRARRPGPARTTRSCWPRVT